MDKLSRSDSGPVFEQMKQVDENGVEYWTARKMAAVLEYAEYRNFKPVIERAKEACANSGQLVENHFVDYHDMVEIGSGAQRKIEDDTPVNACVLIKLL